MRANNYFYRKEAKALRTASGFFIFFCGTLRLPAESRFSGSRNGVYGFVVKLLTMLIFILLIACEEKINISLKSENTALLVVEGVLTNEKIKHLVKLSLPYQTINGTSQPATGAVATVTEGNNTYPLTETPAGSGLYLTDSMIAVVDKAYVLTIQYQGKPYFAQDVSVPVEPMDPLQYRSANKAQYFTLTLSGSGTGANYVRHDINWKNTPFCSTDTCAGLVIYYDLKTIDVNEIYKPSKTEFDFPPGSTIIRTKYSASPAYKAFLRGVLSETEWRGGIFDVERANAPTNLSEGAIGFFAVSTVISDTTVVK